MSSSRSTRAIVLAVSKSLTYVIQFITPIFLTRIFEKNVYGEYREFFIYSSLIAMFINFGIKDNIIYFVSKDPENEKTYVTHTILLKFITYVIGILLLFIFKSNFLELTTYDFFYPMLVYLFLIQNFDYLEQYWLTKKKSDYILYYSLVRMVVRVLIVVTVAYFTSSLLLTLYAAISFEFLRFLYNVFYTIKKKLLNFNINWNLLKEQLNYIIPLGTGAVLLYFNNDISKVIISTNLGAAALASYSIASQRIPLTNVIRSSIGSVIFPDMAVITKKSPLEALALWKRANILYLFLMSPLFFIQFYYAETIITVLFTNTYSDAVPIFRIYLFYFLKQCFEMGTPIRVMNQNKYFLIGYVFLTFVNLSMLFTLYKLIGLWGPAIAFVISEILLAIFFGNKIVKIYKIKVSELLYWKNIFIILAIGLISSVVLYLGEYFPFNDIMKAILFSTLYLGIIVFSLRFFKIKEIDIFMSKLFKKVNIPW